MNTSPSCSENREIGRATGVLASSTLISRVLGLVRNQILAILFGAGFQSDAFIAAFTIPNALRRLFGEGALTPAFVSMLTRMIGVGPKENEKEWKSFVSSSFAWLLIVVCVLCGLGILFAGPLVFLYVPNFAEQPGKMELTVQLTQLLFPFIILISITAFFMGVLNSFRSFFLPAIGPAVLNLCVIILSPLFILVIFPEYRAHGIFIFAGSFLIGALVQVLIQVPKLKSLSALPGLNVNWTDRRVAELGLLLAPAILSMGIHQLNIIVNRVFASDIPSAVSHLFYADLIIELPVSLIATSMATASVPSFSRLASQKNEQSLGESFRFSLGVNLLLSLPSTLGAIVLAFPILATLFTYGQFGIEDSFSASQCLFFYALGLPFFCSLRSFLPLYFAEKDTKTPALIGLIALGVNFYFAWTLSKTMGAPGIALSTSISSFVNFSLLAIIMIFRHPQFPWLRMLSDLAWILICAVVMGFSLFLLLQTLGFDPRGFAQQQWYWRALQLLMMIGIGSLVYFVALWICRVSYIDFIKAKLMKN